MRMCLDIGNVLVHVDEDMFSRELLSLGLFSSSVRSFEFIKNVQKVQDVGLHDLETTLRVYLNRHDDLTIERLAKVWREYVKPSQPMMNLVKKLLKDYDIALLSNIGFDHADFLREECSDVFDRCIQHFSYEVGARKPSKLFYQSFIMEHPRFEGALFFDDREENIKTAIDLNLLEGIRFNIEDYKTDTEAAKALEDMILKRTFRI